MNEVYKQTMTKDAALMAAEAQKIRVVKEAEAQADGAHLNGQGISRCRAAIIEGICNDISKATGKPLVASQLVDLLLMTLYFDTLRDLGRGKDSKAIYLPKEALFSSGEKGGGDVRDGAPQSAEPMQALFPSGEMG